MKEDSKTDFHELAACKTLASIREDVKERPTHRPFESKFTTNCVLRLRPASTARVARHARRVQCLDRRVLYIPPYEYIEACMASVGERARRSPMGPPACSAWMCA